MRSSGDARPCPARQIHSRRLDVVQGWVLGGRAAALGSRWILGVLRSGRVNWSDRSGARYLQVGMIIYAKLNVCNLRLNFQ